MAMKETWKNINAANCKPKNKPKKPEVDWLAYAEEAKEICKPKTRVCRSYVVLDEIYSKRVPLETLATEEQFKLL